MNTIQKFILYSLCLSHSCSFLLHAHDDLIHEDLIIVFDNEEEDIYPIEDNDTICLIADVENYIDSGEFDTLSKVGNLGESTLKEIKNGNILDTENVNLLPIAPEDIAILDHGAAASQKQSDVTVACECDSDQRQIYSLISSTEEPHLDDMSIDQIEESLNILFDMHDEELSQESDELCDSLVIIPVDITETTPSIDDRPVANENCINLSKAEVESIVTDDDIIPVPHDLINSVKKATKKKKKLEKARLKEARKKKKKN